MAGGEVCFQLFSTASQRLERPTQTDVPQSSIKECCTSLKALATLSDIDPLKNDVHSLLEKYDANFYTNVTIFIQKLEAGVWVDKEELLNNSLGTNRAYGFANDGVNDFVGYELKWIVVLAVYGEGEYRFRFNETDFQANVTETLYPFQFCLKEYTPNRANNSSVFTWYLNGFLGDYLADEDVWDYRAVSRAIGSDWTNQMRLDGLFGYNSSEYETERIRYANGREVWIKDEQIESYTWYSGYLEATLHSFLKTNMIQADRLKVTDYNKNQPNIITDKYINSNSSYEPRWTPNKLTAPVTVEFIQEFKNRIKKRC